ncbi:hypothetical protein [Rhodanobacter sp. DHB23]|uniref:hypothetical protein n=1 Tax=Rhodanobacter sp. DHB23 TaxID=2775923 RepID=UPI00177E30AC|nr:hypothetical protein [Rhodanobacter sp. DHB23]MBD8872408.1 hypothetical protein [Rhodanobacter sp. DHB23]
MRSIECWKQALFVTFLLMLGASQADARSAASSAARDQAAAPAPAGAMTMNAAVRQLERQSADRRLLVVGEIHGTTETPALVAELVQAASKDRPVRVGLEWPAWMQDYVAAYLASRGSPDDRKAMLRMGYWKAVPDGRGSRAMVDLVEAVRVLRKSGRDVDVFLMEPDVPTRPADLQSDQLAWKENGMAKALETALATAPKNALVVAYMGRVHSRYAVLAGHPQPSVLQQVMDDRPLYVEVQADAGSAWNCQPGQGCGPHMFNAPPGAPFANVRIEPLDDAPKGLAAEIFDFAVFTPSVPEPRVDGSSNARTQ